MMKRCLRNRPILRAFLISCTILTALVTTSVLALALWIYTGLEDMKLSPHHPFRSEPAKQQYLALYDKRARKWPVPSETRYVPTSYGQTFVRISGPDDAPPLVLLPGVGNNSLMWIPNAGALSATHRVYAVDNIYDHGRSVYTRPVETADDFTNWLDALFDSLELEDNVNLMGASYGAWITCQYALRFPARLDKIVLIAPAGTVMPLSREFIVRALFCVLPFRYFTKTMMYWIAEDAVKKQGETLRFVDESVDIAHLGARCFNLRQMVNPNVLSDEELRSIEVPALYLVGANEKVFSSTKAVERLNAVAPRITTEVIPGAGHDLTIVKADIVHQKVQAFLAGPRTPRR